MTDTNKVDVCGYDETTGNCTRADCCKVEVGTAGYSAYKLAALQAENEMLRLAEEGAKEAFGHIVQMKQDAEKSVSRMEQTIQSQQGVIGSFRTQLAEAQAEAQKYASKYAIMRGLRDGQIKHVEAAFAERDAAQADAARLREALEKLARLGNGDKYGNSVGNEIAIAALKGDV